MSTFKAALDRYRRAKRCGFFYGDETTFPDAFRPCGGAHDDGPFCGLSLGGIGTGTIGRDLHGHFSRWHLQPGYHRTDAFDTANLSLHWHTADRSAACRLGTRGWDRPLPEGARSVAVLFPVTMEHIRDDSWPVELLVESFSPVIPHDDEASCLPVAFFDVVVRNTAEEEAEVDMAFFWPNVLGWRPAALSAGWAGGVFGSREGAGQTRFAWPDKTNAGNLCRPSPPDADAGLLAGIEHRRDPARLPRRDMEGSVFLGVASADPRVHASYHACYRCSKWARDSRNPLLQSSIEAGFFETGQLPNSDFSWRAKPHEVLGGAVAAGATLSPGAETRFTFVLAWDLPLVEAGSGRTWRKAYTEKFGCSGTRARDLTLHALGRRVAWRTAINDWHRRMLDGEKMWLTNSDVVKGAVLNELYYLLDGGTFWVARQHDAAGLPEPALGADEHFAILEGFDSGYYFLNTFDLWPHAMLPFVRFWPGLSRLVLKDFTRSIPLALPEERALYRPPGRCRILDADKIPHDVGSPPSDPWHELNDYQFANDSNVWKDHNPMFLVSAYLHTALSGDPPPSEAEWKTLKRAVAHMRAQDRDGDGLPEHDAHGDNTWDGVQMTGPAIFSGVLTLAAYAAMASWSEQSGREADVKAFGELRNRAAVSIERHFWNGTYYCNATSGERADWVFCDGLLGVLLAKVAGLGDLLPVDHVRSHLRTVYQCNFHGMDDGRWGPSLQAPPTGWADEEGGVQIDEVLVGSAWSCAALMLRVGLQQEGEAIANALRRVLFEESGLQFRTPAAWTRCREYRAPLNLRPLAIGYLMAERGVSKP